MQLLFRFCVTNAATLLVCQLIAAEPALPYSAEVRQVVVKYCSECHGDDLSEAEVNLEQFETLEDARRDPATWLKVTEILASQQMPPRDSKQPTDAERKLLVMWVDQFLKSEAIRSAGDPGPVVLRRLDNAEYSYTIQDITGVALTPAAEFPADNAAGEGFTNSGNAQTMSPALLSKYLNAAKEVAAHAVLLPDGIRFSSSTTRRDWTEESLTEIRKLYAKYSSREGASQVNLQGIVFDTNNGGRLPVEQYLLATIEERQSLADGTKSIEEVADSRQLSRKYLELLWRTLHHAPSKPSLLLDAIRDKWQDAKVSDVPRLTEQIANWQKALWKFASVGHIGKVNGPAAWMMPETPISPRQELRYKLPATDLPEIVLYLATGDAGDGNEADFALWERPRLVAPGRPDLLLRDVRKVTKLMLAKRQQLFEASEKCLVAAAEVYQANDSIDLEELATKHAVDVPSLKAWLDYLGLGIGNSVTIDSYITGKSPTVSNYDFIQGWVGDDALSVLANSSDQHVRIPGNMWPHSIAVHPAPNRQVIVGWQAPKTMQLKIEGSVAHAHPECGNGVVWSVVLRRGPTRSTLASGIAHGANKAAIGPLESVSIQSGDLVSLIIGPKDANHSCDLTTIDLTLTSAEHSWNLSKDVSPNILAANPHPDSFGNEKVWHFYSEPMSAGNQREHIIPNGSLIGRWQTTDSNTTRNELAKAIYGLLNDLKVAPAADSPDGQLKRQLASLSGPLLTSFLKTIDLNKQNSEGLGDVGEEIGLTEKMFGTHPNSESSVEAASLCVRAPEVVEVRLPTDLVAGMELVVTGMIHPDAAAQGSVQFEVLSERPPRPIGLRSITVNEKLRNGTWTDNNRSVSLTAPVVVADNSPARARIERAFEDYRSLFPAALCYTKIVPVDEVVTLTLFYREDDQLRRLMLSDSEIERLNAHWRDLHFVSQDAFLSVDAYEQLWQFATQDADPSAFEPLRKPLLDRAEDFRKELVAAEPIHLESVIKLAAQFFRRELADSERQQLRKLYKTLREEELTHDDAIRLMLARLLVSPSFLYRSEHGESDTKTVGDQLVRSLIDVELATRVSYFLWSSAPDSQLMKLAADHRLSDPQVLRDEARRMLQDERAKRLAVEFGCQWLHIYQFDQHDEKSETAFPTFRELRSAMHEEAIRYLTDLFQRDVSILELLESKHVFVNEQLAKHYGIEGVTGEAWRRVDNTLGRGGILTFAATLSKQSGASRTSPILRGNWVSEVLMGERLPRPPKNVPQLPEVVPVGLTERQLIEQHSSNEACAKCHARIDPLGFTLESYDAIGRHRTGDSIDVKSQLADGTRLDGLPGLTNHLVNTKRDDFVRQFCKKLLGYALGRSVQLSDETLLQKMQQDLRENNYRFGVLIDDIVTSEQFRLVRAD